MALVTDSSSWTELRYSATQTLPEADGVVDELEGITLWQVDAFRVSDDRSEEHVGTARVAVFDLEGGGDLCAPARAYGGLVESAADLLLDDHGRLRGEFGNHTVDRIVLFLNVSIQLTGRTRGVGLMSSDLIRSRLGSNRSLVASYPEQPATNATDPEFFAGVPEKIRAAWWRRGLRYAGDGLWVLPPVARAAGGS